MRLYEGDQASRVISGMVEVDPSVVVKLVVFSIVLAILPVSILQASLHGYFDGTNVQRVG